MRARLILKIIFTNDSPTVNITYTAETTDLIADIATKLKESIDTNATIKNSTDVTINSSNQLIITQSNSTYTISSSTNTTVINNFVHFDQTPNDKVDTDTSDFKILQFGANSTAPNTTDKFIFDDITKETVNGNVSYKLNLDAYGTDGYNIDLQHDLKNIKRNPIIKTIYPHLALSTGTSDKDYKRLNEILKEFSFFEFICIDIANGYSDHFSKFVRSVREKYPTKTIIAGNVVTADMTQELVMSGADIVKVGIGPGSVCTTRIQTGVGYPQLSAVIECADAAHGLGAHIIADGGCTCPGDVAKAFGGGADFVMLGGMFAGHEEGGGKKIKKNGSQFIEFYGSSSDTALDKHYGGLSDYRSSEGKKVQLKFRGKIKDTVLNILGGIRSSCTYVGAPSLKQLSKCTTFIRVNQQFNDTFE